MEANKKIAEMNKKLDKKKKEVKELKDNRDTILVGIEIKDRKVENLEAEICQLKAEEKTSHEQIEELFKF